MRIWVFFLYIVFLITEHSFILLGDDNIGKNANLRSFIGFELPETWESLGPFIYNEAAYYDFSGSYGIPFSKGVQYFSEVSDSGYAMWNQVNTFIENDKFIVPLLEKYTYESEGRSDQVTYFRSNLKVTRPGTYGFKILAEYFSIGNKTFLGDQRYNLNKNEPFLVTLENGNYTILVASLNSGVNIRGFKDFSFEGNIKYYGEGPENKLKINDGYISPDIFPDTRSILVYISVSNIFFEDEDYTDNKNVFIIIDVLARDSRNSELSAEIYSSHSNLVFPGQTYQIPILIESELPFLFSEDSNECEIQIKLVYRNIEKDTQVKYTTEYITLTQKVKEHGQPYKYTFMNFDSSVKSAVAYPPEKNNNHNTNDGPFLYPVIVFFTGMDLEPNFTQVSELEIDINSFWRIYLGGRSSLQNDGYLGYNLMKSAITALSNNEKELPPNIDKFVLIGYLLGAKDVIWISGHYPSIVSAGSISEIFNDKKTFEPYNTISDTMEVMMLQNIYQETSSVYLKNMIGIPILVRTGQNDKNRSFYAKKLVKLLSREDKNTSNIMFSQVPLQYSTFKGLTSGEDIENFITKKIFPLYSEIIEPQKSFKFTQYTYKGYDAPISHGIQMIQPNIPYRVSWISVTSDGNSCVINTDNVNRISVSGPDLHEDIKSLKINGIHVKYEHDKYHIYQRILEKDTWELDTDFSWSLKERGFSTYPTLTKEVYIVLPSNPYINSSVYNRAACDISNAWYKLTGGKSYITLSDNIMSGDTVKNTLITLGSSKENKITEALIKNIQKETVTFNNEIGFKIGPNTYEDPSLGFMAMVEANTSSEIALIIHGNSEDALYRVILYLILGSQFHIPDFVVIGRAFTEQTNMDYVYRTAINEVDIHSSVLLSGYWSTKWEYDIHNSYSNVN